MPRLTITYRPEVVEEIAAAFDLRPHNREALVTLVSTLAGEYKPEEQQVLRMATGAGKTYLMAAFIEYLRREGIGHVLIVTPGLVVQDKTVRNFKPGNRKYIAGAQVPPLVATPSTLGVLNTQQTVIGDDPSRIYVFNIQQLIAPSEKDQEATSGAGVVRRGVRKDNEVWGNIFAQLQDLDDLVIIADESHLYGSSAKAFHSALRELGPAAWIGLTASADKSDHVVFDYPLYRAIEDKCVKTPVLAFRKAGYSDEETQLRDALTLLEIKREHYAAWAATAQVPPVNPILFVTCENTAHSEEVAGILAGPGFLGDTEQVLRVDNTTADEATRARLEALDSPDSPVRAVVSVNMLKEGWDVKNIAVLCALRVSKSQVLTQQTMGRGLRLPFGRYTGTAHVDQLDIISHGSYRAMLREENVLAEFGLDGAMRPGHKPKPVTPAERAANTTEPGGASTGGQEPPVDTDERTDPIAPVPEPSPGHAEGMGTPPEVGVRELDAEVDTPPELHTLTVEVNPEYAGLTFLFPSTRMEREEVPFSLDKITGKAVRAAGAQVSGGGEVITREALTLRSKRAQTILDTTPVEQAEGQAAVIPESTVAGALVDELAVHTLLPRTPANLNIAQHGTVPTFMKAVTVPWTVKSLASALQQLTALVTTEARRFDQQRGTVTVIDPVELPVSQSITYGIGTETHPRIDGLSEFVRYQLYEPWIRSLFPVVSFDSYSAEYKLAELVDTAGSVKWWKRLERGDRAQIAYTVRDNYRPDFVVYDSADDVHWVVEGKAADKRQDENVAAKRAASAELVSKLLGDPRFAQTRWGYFIAYEDTIAKCETWGQLQEASTLILPGS